MIKKRPFGNTGEVVMELGLGTWALGGVGYGDVSERDAIETMEFAYQSGIRFFDTADFYGFGESEKRISRFLKRISKKDIWIATKGGLFFKDGPVRKCFSYQYLMEALEVSLKRIGVNQIDLYQLHGPNAENLAQGECVRFLEEAKKQGKIRAAGVSLYDPRELSRWLSVSAIDSFQLPYNLIDQRYKEVQDCFLKSCKALILREVFAFGFLSGKYDMNSTFPKTDHRKRFTKEAKEKIIKMKNELQKEKGWGDEECLKEALRFCLKVEEASTVLLGVKNKEQLEEHLKNYEKLKSEI